jgi:hypothetical protein
MIYKPTGIPMTKLKHITIYRDELDIIKSLTPLLKKETINIEAVYPLLD